MNRPLSQLWRSDAAATAAEFALVLPLLIMLLLGMVDAGRFMFEVNAAEKATQVGARMAVVTTPVSTGLIEADFASADVPAGELIPADALDQLTCTSTACTCTGTGACPVTSTAVNTASFTALVTRMQQIYPRAEASKVRVIYRGSGFGYAGNPVGGSGGGGGGTTETMEISPLVTVALEGVQLNLLATLRIFSIDLPTSTTTLTSEDASGGFSN